MDSNFNSFFYNSNLYIKMPRKINKNAMILKKRKMRGRGLMSFLRSANRFLKHTKLLSSLGSVYGLTGMPGSKGVAGAAGIARSMGYGRKRRYKRKTRRKRGGSLRLAGQGRRGKGLNLPGGMRRKPRRRRRR